METGNNIYSPPTANLNSESSAGEDGNSAYYVVSKRKFFILFFATLGIYQIYWFFKNWQLYKNRTGDDVWPVPRAIFAIFFVHSLFESIDSFSTDKGKSQDWEARSTAGKAVFLIILANVMDRASARGIGSPYTDVLALAATFFVGLMIYRAQRVINDACDDPQGASNNKLTVANYFWCALGLLCWFGYILTFIGIAK